MSTVPPLLVIGFLLIFTARLSAQAPAGARTWVDQTGRTLRAQFLAVQGANVVLRLENNTTTTVPLARFSAPDQAYVNQRAKSAGRPDANVTALPLSWPESVTVDVKNLQILNGDQNAKARRFVYQTGSFQFTSNAPLTGTVMREIAGDFELVRALYTRLPWGWEAKPEGGGPLFLAMLHETDQDFIEAGGSDNSSGWSKDGIIFTKFSSLGLKKVGERYARDAKLNREGEMIGLINRLIMGTMRDLAMPWSAMGLEKLLEDVAYRNGAFQFGKPERSLKALIAENEGLKIVPNVDDMIKLLHETWEEDRGREVVEIRRRNYFNGALLIYYFGYMDGTGNGVRLHRYFQAMSRDATVWRNYLEARKAGNTSVPNPRPNTKFSDWARDLNKHIIDNRTDEKLKEEIVAKFKANGIKM
jgi:hypothetical protein